jgi:hypothetical protein
MMGLRGKNSGSSIRHIASLSEICVSASMIPFIVHLHSLLSQSSARIIAETGSHPQKN